MANDRGISESELIEEINGCWRDCLEFSSKASYYSGIRTRNDDPDSDAMRKNISKYIASLDRVRTLVNLGRKYLPLVDWDRYDVISGGTKLPTSEDAIYYGFCGQDIPIPRLISVRCLDD